MSAPDPSSCPPALRRQVRRAARLAYCLARFSERAAPGDADFVWAVGRAHDVRRVTGSAVREWAEGRLDAGRAAFRIGSHVQVLEESLLAYARSTRRPS
jgi:hypothetical protein